MIKDNDLVDGVTATNFSSHTDISMNLFLADFSIFEDADLSLILPPSRRWRTGDANLFFL